MKVFLGLGSNLGDCRENISKALETIGRLPFTRVEAVSELISSKPQGRWKKGEAGGDFTNCCARIRTLIPPHRLLKRLKAIERDMGRNTSGISGMDWSGEREYSDRVIDIDILLYGHLKIKTAVLQIPHPRMQERDFVMKPLEQIIK